MKRVRSAVCKETLMRRISTLSRSSALRMLAAFVLTGACGTIATAHPLGNFTVNHFSRIEIGSNRVSLRYIVDMAEISAFQELQLADADGDGATSESELDAYGAKLIPAFADGLVLMVDGERVRLEPQGFRLTLPSGAGGLATLRIETSYTGALGISTPVAHRVTFEDGNHADRIGWHEIVVAPVVGLAVFDSTAFGSPITDELKQYPEESLAAPLAERSAEFSVTTGAVPATAVPLRMRDGQSIAAATDPFAALISVEELTPGVALLGLLVAMVLGGLHAMSPGHGKTVVGAYLVGSRGTWKHAAFLGLTVTVTHTAGVFALGFVTLFASAYVVPEKLFPILSFVSGAIVVAIGASLFSKRLASALGLSGHTHGHDHHHDGHDHGHGHDHDHSHANDHHHHVEHDNGAHVHTHGGSTHSHLPPGADGARVTWKSLLALGVSGGLLPCPSALVVLLSAIALGRVAYGMLLIVAFSAGLAGVLTGVGLLFVYARGFMKPAATTNRLVRLLPALSALVITIAGLAICYEALGQAGIDLAGGVSTVLGSLSSGEHDPSLSGLGVASVLLLGLVFGLKHASEADHVVAVSTIVSEHKSLARAAVVGGLWGLGHTISLVVVGVVVLVLHLAIPETVASTLELLVALMIIVLGALAMSRAVRRQRSTEAADGSHTHFHVHAAELRLDRRGAHRHGVLRAIGLKPVLVGAMHGLAGSAALTLLVLTQIESPLVGFVYLLVFGAGSIGGMLAMSGLVGLPFVLAAKRLEAYHASLQLAAGAFSVLFGVYYAARTSGML
jgi:nickel/cobalt transporter (NicO) family protein